MLVHCDQPGCNRKWVCCCRLIIQVSFTKTGLAKLMFFNICAWMRLQDPSHASFKEKMREFMAKFDKNSDGRIEMSEVRTNNLMTIQCCVLHLSALIVHAHVCALFSETPSNKVKSDCLGEAFHLFTSIN